AGGRRCPPAKLWRLQPPIHGGTMKTVIHLTILAIALQASAASAQALWGGAAYGMDLAQVQAKVPQARVPESPDELAGGESEGLRVEGVEVAGHRFQASYSPAARLCRWIWCNGPRGPGARTCRCSRTWPRRWRPSTVHQRAA